VERVADWQAYLQRLADQGFFQGQLTGSNLHTQLMAKAAADFRGTEAYASHRAAAQKPAERILELAEQTFDPSQVIIAGPTSLCAFPGLSPLAVTSHWPGLRKGWGFRLSVKR